MTYEQAREKAATASCSRCGSPIRICHPVDGNIITATIWRVPDHCLPCQELHARLEPPVLHASHSERMAAWDALDQFEERL